jgi:hypothetical protein
MTGPLTPQQQRTLARIVDQVQAETYRAIELFGPHASLHESLGIIEEEFEEFKKEVFAFNLAKNRDTRPQARTELIQLAAMAVRSILDVIDKEEDQPVVCA